jgi:hypothetical protein
MVLHANGHIELELINFYNNGCHWYYDIIVVITYIFLINYYY